MASAASTLVAGSVQKVLITGLTRSAHVFVQLDTEDAYSLPQLSTMIQADAAATAPPMTSHWSRGDECVALYGATNEWYRARVTAAKRDSVDVFFFDYGNTDTVSNDKVRPLKPQFATLPAQAIECILNGVESVESKLDERSFTAMAEAMLDRELTVKITRTGRVVDIVIVEDSHGLDDLIEDFVKGGVLYRNVSASNIKKGETYDAYVACIVDPYEFWIQLDQNSEKLESLMQRIGELYSYPRHPPAPAQLGSLCCAQYSQDGAWYRAKVLQVQGPKAKVRFIDYGNSEVVEVSQLKQLDPSVSSEVPMAICCALADAEPVAGSQWSQDAVHIFSRIVLDKPLKCIVEDVEVGKAVTVSLIDSDTHRPVMEQLLATTVVKRRVSAKPAQYTSIRLAENQKEEIYITSVDSPAQFWCQRVSSADGIEALMASLDNYYSATNHHSLSQVTAGSPCCGQFTEDNVWYRAVVRGTEPGGKAKVCYVDYGNQETLPLSRVQVLDPQFTRLPIQAISCGLYGIQPAGGSKWESRATGRMQELTEAGSMTITVRSVVEQNVNSWALKHVLVDLMVSKQGQMISIADELVKFGLAVKEGASVSAHAHSLQVRQATLKQKEMTEVEVTFASNPREFWCSTFTGSTDLVPVTKVLKAHCESSASKKLRNARTGDLCGARYSADGEWYRARVEHSPQSGQVSVYFLDYGNSEVVAEADLRQIGSQLLSLPAQAIKCCLTDVHPLSGSSWNQSAVDTFENLISDKVLFAIALGQSDDGTSEIRLVDTSLDDDVDIGQKLVELGVARFSTSTFRGTQGGAQLSNVRKYKRLSLSTEQPLVTIVTVENPQSFWCQLIDEKLQDDLAKIMADMADYYSQLKQGQNVLQQFRDGLPCAAQYTEDDCWYRAEITTRRGDSFEVRYVDYGNSELLRPGRLRALQPAFGALPPVAFCCQLYGIAPTGPVWLSRARTELETLGKDKTLTAKIKSVDPQGKMTVEIYEGDINLAEQLVQMGSAAKVGAGTSQNSSNSVAQRQGHATSKSMSQHSGFTYIVPSLNVGQVEKMVIAYVTSPSEVWCQSPKGQAVLEKMHAAMQSVYGKTPPEKGKLGQAAVGMACVAKSPSDSFWYRAVIKQMLPQDKVEVHYIDYGNLESVPLKHVKMVHRDFKQVPAQALPCALYQCSEPAGGWTDSDRDELDNMVAEIELTGEVKSVQGKPPKYIVDMTFVKDGRKVTLRDAFLLATGRSNSLHPTFSSFSAQEVTSLKPQTSGGKLTTSPPDVVRPSKIDLTPPSLKVGVYEDVCIIGVKTVDHMWCQLFSAGDQLAQLSDNIALYVETVQQPLSSPSGGLFCLAQYIDGAYYRCHIKNIRAASDVEVFFVDYGNVETVNVTALRPISDNLCRIPAQAFTCRLAGVKPKQPGRWSREASAYLERLTIGQQLVARRVHANDIAVDLFDTSDSKDKNIANELVTAGYAVFDQGSSQASKPVAVINPTHMLPGKEYHVLVTHVSSPLKFYCQIQKDAKEFGTMTDRLFTYCSSLGDEQEKIGPLEVAVGKYVAALYSEDGGWYRGKVMSVANHQEQTVRVFFVDYGNEEVISVNSVKCLRQDFARLHALCFEAKLDLVSGDISSEDDLRFKAAVSDQEFLCRVLSSDGSGCNTVQLIHCDKPVNVAEELGFKATVSPPKAPPNRIVDFTHPRLIEGSTIKVVGTVCEESGRFWCQMTDNVSQLESLMAKIEDHYGALATNNQALNAVESACCAKFSEDQAWYRAMITGFEGNNIVVRYVDYGNSETVPPSDLKLLLSRFAELPAQAVSCQLPDLCDISKLSENAVAQFQQLIADQELSIVIKSVIRPGHALVEIPELTEHLKELGIIGAKTDSFEQVEASFRYLPVQPTLGSQEEVFVSHIDSPAAVWCQFVSQEEMLEALQRELSELYSSLPKLSFGNTTEFVPESPCCALYSEDGNWYRAKILRTVGQDVVVCFIDYGNSGNVTASDVKPLLKQFSNRPAQAFSCTVSGLTPGCCDELRQLSVDKTFICSVTDTVGQTTVDLFIKDVEQGKLVNIVDLFTPQSIESVAMAKFKQLEVTEDSIAQVYVSHVVSPSQFFCQYVSHEEQLTAMMEQVAQYCSNTNTNLLRSPAIGLPCLAKFSEDVQFYRAEIQQIGESTCNVVFVDYGNSDNVLFDDLKEITTNLLQLPALCIQCSLTGTQCRKWDKSSTDEFSKLVQSEAASCHFVEQIDGVWNVEIETEAGLVTSDQFGVHSLTLSVPNNTAGDLFIPQIQLAAKSTVDVLVSHIVDPLTFYVQLQSCSDELNSLMEKLAESYISLAEDDLVVQSPVHGMTCCAQFSVDQQWYRAIIIKVSGADCEVQFIDYGNQEAVPLSRIKELKEDLLTFPTQAVLCSLAGVKAPDSGWSDEALSFFDEAVTDKQLKMSVIGKNGNKNMAQLIYPESQELVSEHLTSAGHAVFLDVSTAIGSETDGMISNEISVSKAEDINSNGESFATSEDNVLDSFTVLQLSVGDSFDVKVVSINNLDSFFCSPVSSEGELEELMQKLALSCAEAAVVCLPKGQLVPRAACAAQYSVDGQWYRARVVSVLEGSATVAFVDYGNTETISSDRLLPLNPELRRLPAQAIHCCMADIVSPNLDEGWSDEACRKLDELTSDKILSCTISSLQPEGVYEVQLINAETGEILQNQLIAMEMAIREATELGTNAVLQWQTGTSDSEHFVEVGDSGGVPSLEVDRSLLEPVSEMQYEIQPDIMRDVTVRDVEDGSNVEPVQPDLVTSKVADDENVTQSPLIQPDVVVAQVDLIAKPLAEPEVYPEEPDIQKSVRQSQQQDAIALPELIVSELQVTNAPRGDTFAVDVSATVTVIEDVDEDEAVEAERVHPDDKVMMSSVVADEPVESSPESADISEFETEKSIADELVESVIQSAIDRFFHDGVHEEGLKTEASIEKSVDRVDGELVCDSGGSQSSEDGLNGQLQQVVITHVEDNGCFWARIGDEEDHQEYIDLVEQMNDHYGALEVPRDDAVVVEEDEEALGGETTSVKEETLAEEQLLSEEAASTEKETTVVDEALQEKEVAEKVSISNYSIGDLCAVPWMEDGQWYRGRVTGIITDATEGDSIVVQLIDSGQVRTISLSIVRPLVTPFGNPPEFATYCALAGVDPGSKGCSNEVKTFLGDLSRDKLIYGQEDNSSEEEVTLLHLYSPSDKLKGVSFQIYSSQLPFVVRGEVSGASSDIDSTRVEIGSYRDLQDSLSVSSFAVSERASPPLLESVSEDKQTPAMPGAYDTAATAVAIEVTDAAVDGDGDLKTVDDSHRSDTLKVRKPRGYIYVNKLIVDQGLAKLK